ncbi:UNVERIFIED_CONTAM: Fatty acid amide hydrolase [Sesamum indicum]
MGKKKVMLPADEVDMTAVKYQYEKIAAPHLTGISLKLFVRLLEAPIIGSLIMSHLKQQNKMVEMLRNTVIPEAPMFKPEFPPQEPEPEVVLLDEDGKPEERVELALKTLPHYDPANSWIPDSSSPFHYWKIRDYAYAYRSKLTTPSAVAERFILALDEFNSKKPPTPLLISYDPELIRKQAAASTQRFEEGNPLSVLDGIFIAIKDDIDCYPHPSKGNLMRFVVNANLLGFPAVSVPVGYDKQGLPIGLQIIGRPWCEATILRLAAAVEELCATPKKKPLQFYDILKGN